jgi:hypothetical protein
VVRKFSALLTAILLLLGLGLLAPGTASAAPPYCDLTWGSLGKANPRMVQSTIVNVRSGRHQCFDRLVIDLKGKQLPGHTIRYVKQVSGPSGKPVPLKGGAFLQVSVRAPAYEGAGHATYTPKDRNKVVDVTGHRTFRQVAYVASVEGITDFGLGVRARLPFRVLTLSGPGGFNSRLVIDVAHHW